MLLTLDEGYLLTAALPDLQRGIAPLGPPVPEQPRPGVGPPATAPGLGLNGVGYLLPAAAPNPGRGVTPLGCSCAITVWRSRPLPRPRTWGNSSWPLTFGHGVLPASAPDLQRGVAPLGRT